MSTLAQALATASPARRHVVWTLGVADGHLTARSDGPDRYDVTDDRMAHLAFQCPGLDYSCVVQGGHPGACTQVKQTEVQGRMPTAKYPTPPF